MRRRSLALLVPTLAAAALAACGTTPTPTPTTARAAPVASAPAAGPAERGVFTEDIDRSAAPCDDFYRFANGAWRAKNPIPATQDRWSRRWQRAEANKDQLHDILEEVSHAEQPTGSVEKLVGDYYAACMDEARIDAAGTTPIAPYLAQIANIKTAADVQKTVRQLHGMGIPTLFSFDARPDWHEPARTIAVVGAGGLGLPDRDYYLKPEDRFVKARAQYHAHVAKLFALSGVAPQESERLANVVFDFEKELATASFDNVARRDLKKLDHPTTAAQLGKLTPHFDWAAYLADAHVTGSDFNDEQPAFLERVDRALRSTPVETWRTVLAWDVLKSAAPWLSAPLANEDFDFNQRKLAGVAEMKPRWKRCAESTDALLGEALGQLYVKRHFPPEAKARVQAMVANILVAMKETVTGLAWMGPETKQKALEKVSTFNVKLGYPDRWKDYGSVHVRRDSFGESVLEALRFVVADDRATMGKPTDRGRWGMTPPTSDAYNDSSLNEIVFPAGFLQPPAFDLHAGDPINYGAVGVVIGHEISHSFDDQGAQFDAQGRLANWWSTADLAAFQTKGACVARQFEGYFIEPGIHHQGQLVLGESIGDLAGARIAYRALAKAMRSKPEPVRDGFTPEQQFFVAWGQFRGDETRPETQRLMVQGDEHPIARFRVIGPLSNLPEFKAAFECPATAPMVRAEKDRCEVW